MRRLAALLGVTLVLLVTATPAWAGVRIRGVDVGEFPHVRFTISTDDDVVLTAGNVRLTENAVPIALARIRPLTSASTEVDAVLAIDVSNSMRGAELETALAAARTFVASVPDRIAVGVVAFSGGVDVVSDITTDRGTAAAAVSSMEATTSPGTSLFQAIAQASTMFGGEGQHNLIVLTDGRNTGDGTLQSAVEAARQAGVNVFTLGLAGGHPDEGVLKAIATQTDGAYRPLSADDLDAAYRNLAVQLAQQYVVEYRSKAPYGAPATIEINTPGGSDDVHLVMPLAPGALATGNQTLLARLMSGTTGMAVVVGLAFLAALMFASLIRSVTEQARRQRELSERLAAQQNALEGPVSDSDTVQWVPRPLTDAVERGAAAAGASGWLSRLLERAGWKIGVGEFLLPSLGLPIVVGVLVGLLLNPLFGAILTLVLFAIPFVILSRAARARINLLQAQLADVMMILASSLRAGHSFLQALDSVAKEIDEPAATEFARALAEIQLGRTIDDALDSLAERVGSQDLDWAVTAISIQRKVGGNLAEVLETVASTIRERETIRRQVKVLSAEGRWSVVILILLPFVIVGYLLLVNPSYLAPLLETPVGRLAIGLGATLMVVGFFWMRKIVRLDA